MRSANQGALSRDNVRRCGLIWEGVLMIFDAKARKIAMFWIERDARELEMTESNQGTLDRETEKSDERNEERKT